MKFRVIEKKTGKDVTDTINPCLHHTGQLILLMANERWRIVSEEDYEIQIVKED